ncbi:MAG: hypothetical protein GX626_01605 [Spirochaetales bacterium]|nr:hypothetical protein [Spirochaetales bacterium]
MSNWKVFHPERFQGAKKRNNYFEGWYFKIAMHDEVLCLIPGISLSNDSHAFIQVVSSSRNKPWYVRFPLSSFHSDENRFLIRIGENTFSREQVHLRLQEASLALDCAFTFSDVKEYPVTLSSPGIMGWYAYVPKMECLHAVVATTCSVTGRFVLNGRSIVIDQASGYMEKDWGSSFPKAYLWMQANSFQLPDVSVMLSIAHIPFHGLSFTGFLGFLQLKDSLVRFGTYTRARYAILHISDDRTEVMITTKEHRITLTGTLGSASGLAAPEQGDMKRTIYESIDGMLHLRVETLQGDLLFEGDSSHAGLEFSEASKLMDGRQKI